MNDVLKLEVLEQEMPIKSTEKKGNKRDTHKERIQKKKGEDLHASQYTGVDQPRGMFGLNQAPKEDTIACTKKLQACKKEGQDQHS